VKTCNDCKQELPVTHFNKDNSKKDKLCLYCKECISKRNDAFQKRHRGYSREYYLTNKIRIQGGIERWNANNRDKCREYARKYFAANREKINQRRRELNALRKRKKYTSIGI